MNIYIENSFPKKIAIAGILLAVPAILLWLSAGLWSLLGLTWAWRYIEILGRLNSNIQLLVFVGFPIVTLVAGAVAHKKSPGKLSISVIIFGAILLILAALVFVR